MTTETGLTRVEKADLKRLVSVAQKGLSDSKAAIKEIHDRQLYRETHKTFEAFCQDVFEIGRRHAYQLIEQAEVIANLCANGAQKLPENERQARELAKVPAEEQAEVWEEVVETTARPTAAAIKGVVEQRKAEAKPDPKPAAKKISESEAAALAAIESAEPGRVLLNAIRGTMKQLRALPTASGLELINSRKQSILSSLETAANAVSVYLPAGVCPRCKGSGCAQCGNFGWVNKIAKQQLEK